jgi:hypothetical protein
MSWAAFPVLDVRVGAQESRTLAAMQAELRRSMSELRMTGEPPPYFVAYEIVDRTVSEVTGRLGGTIHAPARRSRTLRVEVRVGDYAFDSSRFALQGFGGGVSTGETALVALDDDYDAIRRELWLTTDAAYKRAINTFARKKAAFQNRTSSEPIPDFSKEAPVETIVNAEIRPASEDAAAAARVRESSSVFAAFPDIDFSETTIIQIRGTRYYVNSEGFKSTSPVEMAALTMWAEAHSPDGMPVRRTLTAVERLAGHLPAAPELTAHARAIAAEVVTARMSPPGEEFAGPVMFDGVASPQFLAETLVPMMEGRRPPDTENPRVPQMPASPFVNRTGLRVLADAFIARDTPSLDTFEGKPVAGSYVVDDEGVRAQDVMLVNNGRLVTLLTSRTPLKHFLRSNGHGRSATVLAGVFQLESTQPVAATQLKEKYLALLAAQDRTFGYIVRDVRPGGQADAGPAIDSIVKVTLDGRETPVRGMRFGDVPATAFRDLADASRERTVFSYRAGGASIVSVIAPSVIFEELEILPVRDILQKPPLVPSPLKTLNIQ